jgi:hypothetical protein
MPSYQDIETRLQVVEDKINFVMLAMKVTRVEGIIAPKAITKTLLEIYLEAKGLGRVPALIKPSEEPTSDAAER